MFDPVVVHILEFSPVHVHVIVCVPVFVWVYVSNFYSVYPPVKRFNDMKSPKGVVGVVRKSKNPCQYYTVVSGNFKC